ncbi:MAG: DUF2505 family protein [Deltaproteobacteria bacterium]|nr:DUF2505 family protein [Deltaproteobacteria bacterium]
MEHRIEHLFDVPEDRLWQVFLFDEEYNDGLYRHLKLKVEGRQLEREGEGESLVVRRTVEMVPDRQIPSVLKAIIRGATLVREEGHFKARERRFEIALVVPIFGNRVDYGGCFLWEPVEGGRKTRRIWEGYCRARIPLAGGALERYLLGEMERGLALACEFATGYFATHAA